MNHYYRTVFHYSGEEDEIVDEKFKTLQEAINEGEVGVESYSAGGETMKLAGEDYYEDSIEFEVEEVFEDDDGNITDIITHSF